MKRSGACPALPSSARHGWALQAGSPGPAAVEQGFAGTAGPGPMPLAGGTGAGGAGPRASVAAGPERSCARCPAKGRQRQAWPGRR